jgi:hypothetical protein
MILTWPGKVHKPLFGALRENFCSHIEQIAHSFGLLAVLNRTFSPCSAHGRRLAFRNDTSDGGWASEFRGVGPKPPQHLDMEETVTPIEENGFLLADLTPEMKTLRYFKWNQKTQPITDTDTLEPFHTTELRRT